MSQTSFESSLGIMGFGHVNKNGIFKHKSTNFDNFLVRFDLTDCCETTRYYLPVFNTSKWFIRVGLKKVKEIGQPGTKRIAPRIHFVERLCREFSAAMKKTNTHTRVDSRSGVSPTITGVPEKKDDDSSVMRALKKGLFPLLFTVPDPDHGGYFLMKSKIDSNAVKDSIFDIVKDLNQENEKEVSAILETCQDPVSPSSENKASFCPTLKKYGMPLGDRRVHSDLLRDLITLNKKFNAPKWKNLLHCEMVTKGSSNLIMVPLSQSQDTMRKYIREHGWVENLLLALGGEEGRERETLLDLFCCLGRREKYKDIWVEAVRLNGNPIPRINEAATKAIQSMANLNRRQMRQLRSCLKTELGSSIFATEFKISQIMNLEYVDPITGIFKYGTERIPWSYKSVVEVFKLWLTTRLEQDRTTVTRFERLDIIINLDHGKGHSRISANFIGRWRGNNGKWDEESHACALGNARCKKDNAEIIKKTFGELLNKDLETMRHTGSVAITPDRVIEFVAANQPAQHGIILPVEVFLASDILLYAIALGKEGSSGWWCTYCHLFKNDWQQANHTLGEAWTTEKLIQHAGDIENGIVHRKNPHRVKGVKTVPALPAIPVSHYVISVLHITIGKGNDVLKNLCAELQAAAETYTTGYVEAQKEIGIATLKLKDSQDDMANFLMVNQEYLKDLRKRRRSVRSLPQNEQEIIALELEDLENEQTSIQHTVNEIRETLTNAKERWASEKRLKENTKEFGQPVHAKLDEILFKHGIDRSGMFGGAIDGNACRRLMANATSIVSEIRDFVIGHESRISGISDNHIHAVCNAYAAYLQALDGYLSCMATKRFHLTPEIATRTEQFRDKCLELERYLQLSITPKSHVVEDHGCQQQRRFRGIGGLDESFGERNHQSESIADRRHGGTRDFAMREKIKSREQAQFNHPEVEEKVALINLKRKRAVSASKKNMQNEAEAKRQKRLQDRESALNYYIPNGAPLVKLQDERRRIFQLPVGNINHDII
jgi:hypothetical protein